MIFLFVEENGTVVHKTYEKVYPIRNKRKDRNGDDYVYTSYVAYISYEYLDVIGAEDYIYLYAKDGEVYITSAQPDGSVFCKKLNLNRQRGSPTSRKYKPDETKNNKWKRIFVVSKHFFPFVSEENAVEYTIDTTQKDPFSNAPVTLRMRLVNAAEVKDV